MMDDPTFKPETCDIQSDGNLKCNEIDVEVQIKGETPSIGKITLKNGKIKDVELVLSEKTIVKNNEGKLVYFDSSTLLYEIGEEVTFDPGDGDRTWNIIDENRDTVTLMLTENLGDAIGWYYTYDNSYGPVPALNYLNSLTTDWDNVDPISSYTYINNSSDKEEIYGYKKLEIKNGVTTITPKTGDLIKLDETNKAKARILTREEILLIASKSNQNLTEENLRKFIVDNLDEVNAKLGLSLTTVDQAIATTIQIEPWVADISKYMQIYTTVEGIITRYKIQPTHDISLPNYLYQHPPVSSYDLVYWTLSSTLKDVDNAWAVDDDGYLVYGDGTANDNELGVRPVITIPKYKL